MDTKKGQKNEPSDLSKPHPWLNVAGAGCNPSPQRPAGYDPRLDLNSVRRCLQDKHKVFNSPCQRISETACHMPERIAVSVALETLLER